MAELRLRADLLPRLNRLLWGGIVLLVVLLAIYVSLGRYLTSLVHRHQDDILREVNARLDFVLEVEEMRGQWHSFQPSFELSGVRVGGDAHETAPVQVDKLVVGVDFFASLRMLSPQLFKLAANGVKLHVDVTEERQLQIPGIPPAGGASGEQLFNFVFNTEHLVFEDVAVRIHEGELVSDLVVNLDLRRDEEFRRFRMSLLSPSQRSWFRAIAEGQGDPLDFPSFVSDFHLEFHVAEVEYYRELGRLLGLEWQGGSVESELWFSMDRGQLSAAASFAAQQVQFAPVDAPEKSIELDRLGATLRGEAGAGRWNFVVSDIEMSDTHRVLQVDALRGEIGNGQLSLGTADLDMGEVLDYLLGEQLLPARLADMLEQLKPRGSIPQARLQVSDIEAPMDSWRINANFENLSVQPWKGAPGVDNAAGFLSIGREEGLVQLRTEDFSMSFPKVYQHPLEYSDFEAQLEWRVYPSHFELRSGPFRGRAEEGQVQGLFAMDIPLEPSLAGPEMDLVVGLRQAHPMYRDKYLPYTLPQTLLDWLQGAVGDGMIEEGAFIYRGSLKRRATDYRTTLSYFDVADAELNYHADWPSLSDFSGLIMINNADVDVWGDSARIRDSQVSDIDVRVRGTPDKRLLLEVAAQMQGDASDGLAIVNDSPLRPLVGDVFSDWQARGDLLSRLQLQLDLSDLQQAPGVQLQTDWSHVSVDMGSLNLVLEEVNGQLFYDQSTGFSSDGLTASLWGRPISGRVSQGARDGGLAELDIAVQGEVSAADIQRWLDLDLLAFASGEAELELHVLVPPADMELPSRIEASSALRGVAMDLPQPWVKSADSERQLQVSMPLAGEPRVVSINMEGDLFLRVELGEEGYQAGSLGFGRPLTPPKQREFVIGGDVARVESEQWADFIIRYLMQGEDDVIERQAVWLATRDFHIDEFVFQQHPIRDVNADARQTESGWTLDMSLPWMQGRANISEDFSEFDIELQQLNLDELDEEFLASLQESELSEFEMPRLRMSIAELWWQGANQGQLQFSMQQQGPVYQFRELAGQLRSFELGGGEQGLELDWQRGEQESTHLRGRLAFKDFGDVLTAFNYERIVETESGELLLDLAWPSSPVDFQLGAAEGSLKIDVEDGRFLKTSAATSGTLRVVAILNLADFVRRLSLDLSYMFQSGVPFDGITGEVLFRRDQLEVSSLDVLGRSSRFQFVGVADVPTQSLDGELVATLPVASNLPWVAALVSGLPAAAAVYVASKVFTKQMDRFSSAIYSIDGQWSDPQVNFQRIFDDTASQKKVVGEGEKEPLDSGETTEPQEPQEPVEQAEPDTSPD